MSGELVIYGVMYGFPLMGIVATTAFVIALVLIVRQNNAKLAEERAINAHKKNDDAPNPTKRDGESGEKKGETKKKEEGEGEDDDDDDYHKVLI